MAIRDRIMKGLIEARIKSGDPPSEPSYEPSGISEKERLELLFDGIKLIGTGNGAGALASIVGLYYFRERVELQFPVKLAAIIFIVGLLIHAATLVCYISGLNSSVSLIDRLAKLKDVTKLPEKAWNSGIDGLLILAFSFVAALAGLLCFLAGISISLYAVTRL